MAQAQQSGDHVWHPDEALWGQACEVAIFNVAVAVWFVLRTRVVSGNFDVPRSWRWMPDHNPTNPKPYVMSSDIL